MTNSCPSRPCSSTWASTSASRCASTRCPRRACATCPIAALVRLRHGPAAPAGWGDLGFAGLRVHYALSNSGYKDELVAFLGASYFRALGKGQQYGLSARGLAIDTAGGSGEEFPAFTEFWLEQPRPMRRA